LNFFATGVPASCDIFCNVIDNYGDIGVSWRLARQLANEFNLDVRLFVDDLQSFARLCPEADAALESQHCRGVEVKQWGDDFSVVQPADLVIDAFGCTLPPGYLAAMTAQTVWINLEYLSAEDWVEGCHKLPSPKPPLTRYFFFPGFTEKTGGLLLEQDLLQRRDAFLSDPVRQQAFWRSIGMVMPAADPLKISMFAYENDALAALFDVWASGDQTVLCLVPEGRILPQVRHYFAGRDIPRSDEDVGMNPDLQHYSRGNLRVRILPFAPQERYDELLWACDINFVRGEDSCVRAQWAGKPFVWQIYPQHDAVHWDKLQAFLNLYDRTLDPAACRAMQGLWHMWNGGAENAVEVWRAFTNELGQLNPHAKAWACELSVNNLALNLLAFSQEIGRMRAFEIDEQ
jgi:uncharacterized repeat protein (TIGR03837 family)